jgi:carboxymethylenebutenolidase
MKNLTLTLILFLMTIISSSAVSHEKHSCCTDNKSCIDKFAELGGSKEFQDLHLQPAAFTLKDAKGKMITFITADGKTGSAYEVKASKTTDKYILIFHEWWGLNDYIKKEADEIQSGLDVNVLAIDLYDGKVAATPEEAGSIMKSLDKNRAFSIILGAANYAGINAVFGTMGWCFGGGWSLQASIALGKRSKACVMYYGMPETDIKKLEKLQAPVLGIFGTLDQNINPGVVKQFQADMKKSGKSIEVHSYKAVHAFANPSNPKFDEAATKDAKMHTYKFFKDHLVAYR